MHVQYIYIWRNGDILEQRNLLYAFQCLDKVPDKDKDTKYGYFYVIICVHGFHMDLITEYYC